MIEHEKYMRRCLEIARHGKGNVSPNPMVGSVIVHAQKIISEGYHQQYGGPHAEVNAINGVQNQQLLRESTLYVNLEPCAHFGKTPPCSDLIIEKQIPRVVIGCVDSFSQVAGKGIERMRKAGIEVIVDVLERESRWLNRRFFTFHEQKRPYIILKWAETLDGFIDRDRQKVISKPIWITNDTCRTLVHKQRATEDAVMVGTNTAENDNPFLNIRKWHGQDPLRVVPDRNLRLSNRLHIFNGSQPTLIFTEGEKGDRKNLEYIHIDFSADSEQQFLEELHRRGILSVIIEGGSKLLQNFIRLKLWDEAWRFIGNATFEKGVRAPLISGDLLSQQDIDKARLLVYKSKNMYF